MKLSGMDIVGRVAYFALGALGVAAATAFIFAVVL
jgi:hypothetical protein